VCIAQAGEVDPPNFERKDGKFLLRFLRARKFDMDRALQLYINYYKYKHKFKHLLADFHPKHVNNVLNAGIFGILDGTMKNRSRVLCVFPERWSYLTIPPNDPYKTFLMILEKLVEDEEVQVHGLSILDNMEGMSWHLGYAFLRCEQLSALVELQDSFPIRFKGFHMFNQPWYLSMIMAVVRPFLSQKHRERIRTHGENYGALADYIEMSHLPTNFGGDGGLLEADNLQKFFESDVFECGSLSSQTFSFHSGRE
jgi:retinaldehyde-binding protein 1